MAKGSRGAALALLTASLLFGANAQALGLSGPSKPLPACTDQSQRVYFEENSAKITREAKESLKLMYRASKRCTVLSVTVLGLSADPGGAETNMALSQDRAKAVVADLKRLGLKDPEIQVSAHGDVDDENSKGQARPMRRRVDVALHLTPQVRK